MNFLERILPSLRRHPEIASVKKSLEKEKKENLEARNKVLKSIKAVVDDFEIFQRKGQARASPKRKR